MSYRSSHAHRHCTVLALFVALGGCASGAGVVESCDVTSDTEVSDADTSLGFSAADVVAHLDTHRWGVSWVSEDPGFYTESSVTSLEATASLASSGVHRVEQASAGSVSCAVTGTFLVVPLDIEFSDGADFAVGGSASIAAFGSDDADISFDYATDLLEVSSLPDDLVAAGDDAAAGHDSGTGWAYAVSTYGNAAGLSLTLGEASGRSSVDFATAELAPE